MAKKQLPAPDYDYISNLRVELQERGQLKDDDDQIDEMRLVREQKQPQVLSADLQLVHVDFRDSTVADEGFRVTASMSVNPDKLTVTPQGKGEDAIKNGTLREHFTQDMFRTVGSRRPGMDTATAVKDAIVNDGAGWCKFLFTRDVWDYRYSLRVSQYENDPEDFDEETEGRPRQTAEQKHNRDTEEGKKSSGPPFAWIHVDTRTVYPVFSGGKIREVLEVQERPMLTSFREYRLKLDKEGNIVPDELGDGTPSKDLAGKTVRYMELWDDTWATVIIEGKNVHDQKTGFIVKQWRHGYGRHPYFQAYGLMMNHWRNRKTGWGIGQTKKWLCEYLSYLLNIQAQFAARDCYAPLFRKRDKDATRFLGEDGKPQAKEKWGLMEIIEGAPGEDLAPIAFAGTPSSLKDAIAMVRELIAQLDTPRMNANLGSLEGAGFALNQVLAELKIRFDPLVQSYERMMCELTYFAWHLIRKKVRETVWVRRSGKDSGYLSAGPDDLKDVVGIEWTVDPERPTAKVIERRYHVEGLEAGLEGLDQAIEAEGNNPDEVRLSRSMDRIRQQPWYIQEYDRAVAQEAGLGDLMERAMALAQTGIAPPGVPPAMGNELVPDMGNLAMAPNGAGAAPMGGVGNGVNMGVGPGAVVPQQSATPLAQGIVA